MSYRNPRAALEYRPEHDEILCGVRERNELTVTLTRNGETHTLRTKDWMEAYAWLGQDEAAWRLLCSLGCPTISPPGQPVPV